MSRSNLKRPLSTADRGISPPSVRRKTSPAPRLSARVLGADTLRIYSWNVNGIHPLLQKQLSFQRDQAQSDNPLRTYLRRHQWPHFVCLQEVKISSRDEATQRRLQSAANEGVQQQQNYDSDGLCHIYTVHFSFPRDKYNATGFGGKVHGVATLIRDDVAVRYGTVATSRPDWDLEGRVLIHTFAGLAVVNGYWPNGTSNDYRSSVTGAVQGTRHDFKLRFHEHMLELAKSKLAEPQIRHIILVGDVNVARGVIDGHPNLRISPAQHVKNRADFNSKFFGVDEKSFNGVDVFREIHKDTRKYTYHPRGRKWGESCDRVDLIIVDQALREIGAVVDADICDNARDRGHSDHVPLWVAIDMSRLSEKQDLTD